MRKMLAHVVTGTLAVVLAFATATVVSPETAAAKKKKVSVKKVTAVSPSGKTAYVAKGKKVKITATVKVSPNKKANKKVTYKSANKSIATVSSKGIIKAKKAGKTKITVISKKNKKKKATVKVVVKKAAVKKVTINAKSFVLTPGAKKTLKAKVSPSKNVSKKVAWTSSNKKVATVSSKGVVKAIGDGKATITAKATDGSNKKAKVTVTVGAGIASVSVPTYRVVRVVLTSAKTLSKNDFKIQTRAGQTSTRYTDAIVDSISTNDRKVYDVSLRPSLSRGMYLNVSIPSLATQKTMEIYVDKIAEYGQNTNETISYVTSKKDKVYSEYWYVDSDNVVGDITYSVSGLPSGLKAYISENKTGVYINGKFSGIENGTTAVLTGVDSKGTTFTSKYIFYVGDDNTLVGGVKPVETKLAYVPDNPKTAQDEESGFCVYSSAIRNYVNVAGGSGAYSYSVTWNGKLLSEFYRDADGNAMAVPAGTYSFDVKITDDNNESLTKSFVVTVNMINGVTVSGTVRDLSGNAVKNMEVYGHTKEDAYGRAFAMYAKTKADGTYTTRVVPGDYYTYCDSYYDATVGNVFNANATKNFNIPYYRVNIVTNIAGVAGYDYNTIRLLDSYGRYFRVITNDGYEDGDVSMCAYLRPGYYEVDTCYDEEDTYYNKVYPNAKIETSQHDGWKSHWLSNGMGEYRVSGSFSISGSGTVTLNATKVDE